jgi:hypothetical protein
MTLCYFLRKGLSVRPKVNNHKTSTTSNIKKSNNMVAPGCPHNRPHLLHAPQEVLPLFLEPGLHPLAYREGLRGLLALEADAEPGNLVGCK